MSVRAIFLVLPEEGGRGRPVTATVVILLC